MTQFHSGSFRYSKDAIFKRLKIIPGTSVYEYSDAVFPRLESIVHNDLELVCRYSIIPNTLPLDSYELDGCDLLVICYVGCTQKIMDKITAMMDSEELLEGYILNDLTNSILFSASDNMNCQIHAELKSTGRNLSSRITPGENQFPMKYQSVFLDLLKKEEPELQVSLTPQYMLQPEKAMLYAYGGGKNITDHSIAHDCSKCSNLNCFYRKP